MPLRSVFEDHALGEQILANAIGLAEVTPAARVLARLDGGVDLGLRDRRRRILGAAQRQHAEHAIEVVERGDDPGRVALPHLLVVHRDVERADQIEDRAEAGRGVQVVAERGVECVDRFLHARRDLGMGADRGQRFDAAEEIGDAPQRLFGLLQAGPREVQLLAVVAGQQDVAQRRQAEALVEHVLHRVDVADRLRHLLVVDEQVLDVEPEARELLAGRAFALRDLVLVMRKHQVDAAGVDVDRRFAEQPQRHRRALDVPAGTAGAAADVPRRLARLGRLPQHEVARALLVVLVGIDARAGLDAFVIEPRQLAVRRQRRDLEVDRSVARVGMAALAERVDHVGHRLQVRIVGRARRVFDRLDAERGGVLAKRLDVLIGVFAQRQARLRRADDGLVVHVGEVHDVVHLVAADVLQRAPQHVHADERAEVADVAARVDRQPARVHAHGVVDAAGRRPPAAG